MTIVASVANVNKVSASVSEGADKLSDFLTALLEGIVEQDTTEATPYVI